MEHCIQYSAFKARQPFGGNCAIPGAWYRTHRIVSLDGTTLDVADTRANARDFGRPTSARGVKATGAFPQLRLVGLVETGTHVVFGATLGRYGDSEAALAPAVLAALRPDMLCLADRYFPGYDLWRSAAATGAALVWRAKATTRFPVDERFADGSYRSTLRWAILRELLEERGRSSRGRTSRVRSSRGRTVPRGVKRKMRSDPLRPRRYRRRPPLNYTPGTSLSDEYWG